MEESKVQKHDIGKYASIGSMGSIIILLLHNVQVLDQHGEELNHVRADSRNITHQIEEQNHSLRQEIATHIVQSRSMELRVIELEHKMDDLDKMARDPYARPDAHTRTDDHKAMINFREWVEKNFVRQAD